MESPQVPTFLTMAADSVRWALLLELSRSDRQVEELVALVGKPQNLVSYHLGRLRGAGMVAARRSASDGRQMYYRLEVARCGELLREAGGALHPALATAESTGPAPVTRERGQAPRVLFLCTENSARSQMAEALLRELSRGTVGSESAGSRPSAVNPLAVRVMAGLGIDIRGQRAKGVTDIADARIDLVVTVCDRVRAERIQVPGAPEQVHWSVADPAGGGGIEAFEQAAEDLRVRVAYLLRRLEVDPG